MLGSLGLLRQLSALGAAANPVSRKAVSAKLKRLDPELQRFFKDLKKREDEKVKAAQDERSAQLQMFFAQYMPEPVSYKKEDAVVSAFLLGDSASHSGMKTDGVTLEVNGRTVASRDPSSRRFVKVCPGAFGTEKQGRRAANAALKILGAHLRVDDKTLPEAAGGAAFLRAIGKPGRVLHDDDRCYTVEVSKKIQEAALRAAYSPASEFGPVQSRARQGRMALTKAERKAIEADFRAEVTGDPRGKLSKTAQKKLKAALKRAAKERKAARDAAMKPGVDFMKAIKKARGKKGVIETGEAIDGLGRFRRRRSRR